MRAIVTPRASVVACPDCAQRVAVRGEDTSCPECGADLTSALAARAAALARRERVLARRKAEAMALKNDGILA